MSNRSITSPGIEIAEIDQSTIARTSAGTNIFMTGFAPQGPTDEVVNIGSVSEFEATFGTPTNAAERYLYHSARQVLTQSPANLLVTRMAYGSGVGAGFANSYSALIFPVKGYRTSYSNNLSGYSFSVDVTNAFNYYKTTFQNVSAYTLPFTLDTVINQVSSYHANTLVNDISAAYRLTVTGTTSSYSVEAKNSTVLSVDTIRTLDTYTDSDYLEIQAPYSILLDETEYQSVISNSVSWSNNYSSVSINNTDSLGLGGIVVLNPTKVSVDSLYQGYYVALADNENNNPGTDFQSVTGIKAVGGLLEQKEQFFNQIPTNRLNFALSSSYLNYGTSISRIIEQYPTGYDFSSPFYNDSITLMNFKVRTSVYAQDTVTLDYRIQQGFTGSLYINKTQNNPNGGSPLPFSLEKVNNGLTSSDVKIIVNPYISSTGEWTNPDGSPKKTVRVAPEARNLYSLGVYVSDTDATNDELGNVPLKLQRILNRLDDLDTEIDIIPEAGLGTIWTGACARKYSSGNYSTDDNDYLFDERLPVDTDLLVELKSQGNGSDSILKQNYDSIIQQFNTFASKTRMDHMFIADPLRYIFVNGPDFKTSKINGYNFSLDVYWPLKNLYSDISTSYGATYGNWLKFNDNYSNQLVWLPSSGYVAADIAFSSAINFPWSAPAGFNRGVMTNITDIAINPTQKQRDLLYRININPIAFFPGDGYVIYGQKTLLNKPSAFDRINVRRLFLTLEKTTKQLLKYFVFEPNTFATRARLINSLAPTFNQAKANDGLYDYKIICDERNNTPDIIDNNELKIAIYIQAVRTAEFILADFVATRTGVNFNEITS